MNESKNPLLNSGIVLASATAFLYCASTANFRGYLGPLKLDADVLDRNFHQILYNGFLDSFGPVWLTFFAYAAAHWLYSYAIRPNLIDWLRKSTANRRRFLKVKYRLVKKRKASKIELHHKQRSVTMLTYAALAFVLILSLVYFEWQGKTTALADLKQIADVKKQIEAKKSLSNSAIIRVKIDDQFRSLFYLKCGARNCAGIDPVTMTVYYFPQNGHSYQYIATTPLQVSSAVHSAP
jgi:hypothetical protein